MFLTLLFLIGLMTQEVSSTECMEGLLITYPLAADDLVLDNSRVVFREYGTPVSGDVSLTFECSTIIDQHIDSLSCTTDGFCDTVGISNTTNGITITFDVYANDPTTRATMSLSLSTVHLALYTKNGSVDVGVGLPDNTHVENSYTSNPEHIHVKLHIGGDSTVWEVNEIADTISTCTQLPFICVSNKQLVFLTNNLYIRNLNIYITDEEISYTCYGKLCYETTVTCSGHGDCITHDVCECEDTWIGPECQAECIGGTVPTFECLKDCGVHGVCTIDEIGAPFCVCTEDWFGSVCDSQLCDPPCINGICDYALGVCLCESQWTGVNCKVPTCDSECSNGECVAPNKCVCDYGWTGTVCEQEIVVCCTDKCMFGTQNEATCDCLCEDGWSGPTCGDPNCTNNCTEHGTCVLPNQCICNQGWVGDSCEEETEEIICEWPFEGEFPDCTRITCWGVDVDKKGVCGYERYRNSHGNCLTKDVCDCCCGWYGPRCGRFSFGIYKKCKTEKQHGVCSNKGKKCKGGKCNDEDRRYLFNAEGMDLWSDIYNIDERVIKYLGKTEEGRNKMELLKKLHELYKTIDTYL